MKTNENDKSGVTFWGAKIKTWTKIKDDFEAQTGHKRDAKTLHDKYANKKKQTKHKFASNKENINTGSGKGEMVELSYIDMQMLDILDLK